MKLAYLYPIAIFLLLISCKTQNLFESKKLTSNQKKHLDSVFYFDQTYQYKIRKDDKISISVWGQDQYSVGSLYGIYNSNEVYGKWLLVDINGNIELPQYGTFNVLGKTIIELKDSLKTKFSKILTNPIVDVKVLNKEILIIGEVRNTGSIPVDKDRNTLLEIITKAGGYEFYANLKKIKVLRQDGPHTLVTTINLTKAGDYKHKIISLHPGDVVIVPSKKSKVFDKRISTIVPFTAVVTAIAVIIGFVK